MADDAAEVISALSVIGQTNFRHYSRALGIPEANRLSDLYILGQTGVGRSTLIEQLARQGAKAGKGFAIIKPHGDNYVRTVTSSI